MNEKLFMKKANQLKGILSDKWDEWPVSIRDFGNVDGDPVRHGLFISPLDIEMTGLEVLHVITIGRDYNRDDYFSEDFNGNLEEFIFDEGDSKITVSWQNIGFNKNRELLKYSLFSSESVVDFDELFNKLDVLLVEVV